MLQNKIKKQDLTNLSSDKWDEVIFTAIDFASEVCMQENNYISIYKNNYKIVGPVPTFGNEVGLWVKMPINGKVSLGALKSNGEEKIYDMTMGGLTGEWSSWGTFSVSLGGFPPAKLSCNEPSD